MQSTITRANLTTKKFLGVLVASLLLLTGLTSTPAAAAAPETLPGHEVAFPFGPPADFWDADGESTLTRTAQGMSLKWDVEGLTPGNVYSVWWGVANVVNDGGADGGTCVGSGDFYVFNATGGIANKKGEAKFRSHITTKAPTGEFPVVLADFGGGDITPLASHVFNVVVDHGPIGSNDFTTAENMHSILGAAGDVLIHDNMSQFLQDGCPV
jgi:hypothetical protein